MLLFDIENKKTLVLIKIILMLSLDHFVPKRLQDQSELDYEKVAATLIGHLYQISRRCEKHSKGRHYKSYTLQRNMMIKKYLDYINSTAEEEMPYEKLKIKNQKRQQDLDENYNNWRTQLIRSQRDGGDTEITWLEDYTLEDIIQEVYNRKNQP